VLRRRMLQNLLFAAELDRLYSIPGFLNPDFFEPLKSECFRKKQFKKVKLPRQSFPGQQNYTFHGMVPLGSAL